MERQYATYTGGPTYPGGPEMTVDALLATPRVLLRDLTDLEEFHFVADNIFARGTADQIAGGVAWYQRSESIFPNRDPEEVGVRSEFPRAAWSEEVRSAFVKKYGLEVPISFEAARRNQIDMVTRAQRKLANALVKSVDSLAMTLLTTDPDVPTTTASGDWSTAATSIVADLANARKAIADQNEGYNPNTLVVNPAQELDLLLDAEIRDALPRESQNTAIQQGRPVPILGFTQVLVTPWLTAGTVLVLQQKVIGTIADESPAGNEGYTTYSPGAGRAPLYMKIRRDDDHDDWIVRVLRLPAMWLSEPKAAFKITGA
jgi:hypothetical protein